MRLRQLKIGLLAQIIYNLGSISNLSLLQSANLYNNTGTTQKEVIFFLGKRAKAIKWGRMCDNTHK
jgi:hypothetical protein